MRTSSHGPLPPPPPPIRMPTLSRTRSRAVEPVRFVLPDLDLDVPFELSVSAHGKRVGAQSDAWMLSVGKLSDKKQASLHGLQCGLLAAMTYPYASPRRMRTCCDFLSFLFHLDDLSDHMDKKGTVGTWEVVMRSIRDPAFETSAVVGKMAKDIWDCLCLSAAEGTKERFVDTFDAFFRAVAQQAVDRHARVIPDLQSYMSMRRDTSGCKPCWALIEYAYGLDIPGYVMENEAVQVLGEAANDFVSWSNDTYSYKVEHGRSDTHNMVFIAMHTMGLSLQESVDYVGEMCVQAIMRFLEAKRSLPEFDGGGRVDREVAAYARGLEDWIVGSMNWSFETTRYFGADGRKIKKSMVVEIVPRKPKAQ